jgi:hypothetical protein
MLPIYLELVEEERNPREHKKTARTVMFGPCDVLWKRELTFVELWVGFHAKLGFVETHDLIFL